MSQRHVTDVEVFSKGREAKCSSIPPRRRPDIRAYPELHVRKAR